MLWNNSGISVYFFQQGSVPADLNAGQPVPNNWGTPMASWPATSCNPSQFFYNHQVIFDTTLWYVFYLLLDIAIIDVFIVDNGHLVSGLTQAFPDKKQVARLELELQHASSLSNKAEVHSLMLVSVLVFRMGIKTYVGLASKIGKCLASRSIKRLGRVNRK